MNFAIADLKNRYRNSLLGVFWTLLEPLLTLSVLYIVFSSILRPNVPNFAVYLLLGLITWNFIKNSTGLSLVSISNKQRILSNVYFMREIPALSSNITALMMLGIEFIIFSFFLIGLNVIPGFSIIFLPIMLLFLFMITLGLSLPLSVLTIGYKDIKFIWNLIITAGFFFHPIFYTLDMLPENLQTILRYLPTVRLIEIIHQIVLFNSLPTYENFLYVFFTSIFILGLGYFLFRKFEHRMMEEL